MCLLEAWYNENQILLIPTRIVFRHGKQVVIVSSFIDAIARIYAVLAVVPYIPFLLVWFVVYFLKKEKKLATKWAMDVTTAFLIGVVAALYNTIFQSTFGFYLLLIFFLLAFGLLGNFQYRSKGRADLRRIARAVWRLGFLGLTAAYLVLIIINAALH